MPDVFRMLGNWDVRIMKAECYNYQLIKIDLIYSRAIKTG